MVHDIPVEMLIPSTILITSFLGSWHCVGMCGGLVAASTYSPSSVVIYHIGRLLGYCFVGGLSGWVGHFIVPSYGSTLSTIFMSLLSLYFIWLGVTIFRQKSSLLHFNNTFIESIFATLLRKNNTHPTLFNSGVVGLFSVFLPCGWLYTFVIATMTLKSPIMSVFFLSLFWVGTLPALLISPIILRKVLTPMKQYLPKISGIVLILAGLGSLFIRL